MFRGRRTDFGLGAYPEAGLAEARERAHEWRRLIRSGQDPRAVAIASTFTLEAAVREFHAKQAAEWAPGHAARWIGSLERHVFPKLGAQPMGAIKPRDVAEVLAPLWTEKHDTAKRLRQRIMGVFEWADAAGLLDGPNPMASLPRLLRPVKREVEHFRAMPWREVPALYAALRRQDAMSARVLAFLLLTAARSQEARGARWSEVSWSEDDGHVWTVPAARMKIGTPHRIPLSPPAVALLEGLRGLDAELVFPSPARPRARPGPIGGEALSALRRRMGVHEATTAHGLRATFKTWGADTGQDRTLVELCLSHAHGDRVEQAYLRSDMFARRRIVMDAWAAHVTGAEGRSGDGGRGAEADAVRRHGKLVRRRHEELAPSVA